MHHVPDQDFYRFDRGRCRCRGNRKYPANNRPPVNVLSSGVYEIVGNGASVWVLHTSTGKLKFYETSRNIKDKPLCSETQSFD